MNNAIRTIQEELQLPYHTRYEARVSEVIELFDNSNRSPFDFGFNMFLLGFARGRKCEQKLQKEKKRGAAV